MMGERDRFIRPTASGKPTLTGALARARLALVVALALGSLFRAAYGQETAPAESPAPAEPARTVLVVDVTGVIGVATTLHVEKGMEQARRDGAELVVLRVDTPGGLVSSTREIVQAILRSPVPVVGYVAPGGAHAASAGTYIIAATHVAAMAPGTQIGAATPIQLGETPTPSRPTNPLAPADENDAKKSEGGEQSEVAAERKAVNDAVAFIRSLGQMRGRNVDWLEKAVREAATLTAEDALAERVIEIVARDLDELLDKLDGRPVTIAGTERKLASKGATVVQLETDWRTDFLAAIADPNIAFILLMIGIYGIMFEFWNPGAVAPGVVGGICLLLGLTALTLLPLNYAGLALVLFGIALMVAEKFSPGYGVLGIGGVASFVVGAIFLFDPAGADVDIAVAWPVIVATAGTSFLLMTFIVGFAVRARQRPVMGGGEEMIGLEGEVVDWQDKRGTIRVHSEIWSAESERAFKRGDRVQVTGRKGLILTVRAV
jgi:membrane-bound serine protease (ClpP class)